MKVFQIVDGVCYYDATRLYPDAKEAAKHYARNTLWVDAPDYVFEGWGFDKKKAGTERFIKPIPPVGWAYDDETGTYYPDNTPSEQDDINAMLIDHELRLSILELGGDI